MRQSKSKQSLKLSLQIMRMGVQRLSQVSYQIRNINSVYSILRKKVLEKISKKLGRNEGTESDKVKEFLTEWTTMVNHSTVSEFEDSWVKLQEKWNETASSQDVIEYLTNEYIHKKEKFVRAYTNHNLHLGNVTSSRVEGAHAALKKYLGGSTGNLYIVFESMEAKLNKQYIAASKKLSDGLQLVPNWLNISLFKQVVKKISSYTLGKVYEQYLKFQCYHQSKEELPAYTKYHQPAIRLPCAHTLQNQLPYTRVEQSIAFKDLILELPQLQMTDFASHCPLLATE